jgi:hypothetical protein
MKLSLSQLGMRRRRRAAGRGRPPVVVELLVAPLVMALVT